MPRVQTFSRPFIVRQTETERLVSYLLDFSSYGPVALTTHLKGTLGFGKTSLAKAVCADPRVIEMFSDGIVWVPLGAVLTPLDLLRRAENALFTLTGEHRGLASIQQAQQELYRAIHPKRLLVVLDDAGAGSAVDEDAISLFSQSVPGGATLIITQDDSVLPMGTRRVMVDLMYSEAAELLGAKLPLHGEIHPRSTDQLQTPVLADQPLEPGPEPPAPSEPSEEQGRQEQEMLEDLADLLTQLPPSEDDLPPAPPPVKQTDPLKPRPNDPPKTAELHLPGSIFAAGEADPGVIINDEELPPTGPSTEEALPSEEELALAALADRLNDWPLLLALVNGLLHGCLADGTSNCATLADGLRVTNALLDEHGLDSGWQVEDAQARDRALRCVVDACLAPLSLEERSCWLELCVFPPEEAIPLDITAALWGMTIDQAEALAATFSVRGLAQVDPVEIIGNDAPARPEFTIRVHPAFLPVMQEQLGDFSMRELHARLVSGLRARCDNWPAGLRTGGPAANRCLYRQLAYHLEQAGRRAELQVLLFDFDWLAAVLNHTRDLYGLLIDFQTALSAALDRQSAQLRLVQEALMDAAPVLAGSPDQLAPHLLGRLLTFGEPEIQSLLHKAMVWQPPEEGSGTQLSSDQEEEKAVSDNPLLGNAESREAGNASCVMPHPASPRRLPWLRPLAACFPAPGGNQIRALEGHTGWVTGGVILPDGQFSISASLDGTLRVWDMASGLDMRTWIIDSKGIPALAVTPDGARAVTAGWEGRVMVWDLSRGFVDGTLEEVTAIHASVEPVGALAVTPDGKRLVTGADDRMIKVWDIETGEALMEFAGHTDLVRALAVTPDGRTVVSGGWDNTVRLWDLETGELLHTLMGHSAWVRAVTITPNGYNALSGGWDRVLRVWDLWTGEEAHAFPVDTPIYSITVTPDSKAALAGSGDGQLYLWDLETGSTIRTLPGHKGGINSLGLTRSGRFALSTSDDRTLRVWDLDAIQGIHPQPHHDQPVCTLAPLPENAFAVSASLDGSIKIWDAPNGREVCTLEGHPGGVAALTLSADGRTALSGGADCVLRVWDLAEPGAPRDLPGHAHSITCAGMTPDARLAVSGDQGGVLKVWDITAGTCLASFHGEGPATACALASDGKTVVASAAGGKMYFLEVR